MNYDFLNLNPLYVGGKPLACYAVYDLPCLIDWEYIDDSSGEIREIVAHKVKIGCDFLEWEFGNQPSTIVIPYDQEGWLWEPAAIIIEGPASIAAAMKRIGYEPVFSQN